MAAAAPSPLASSVEKTNGAKLSRLLIDGGTTVLRNVFDRYHPPANLAAGLTANHLTLNTLKTRRVLHQPQWDLLFPPGGVTPDSKTFDITLLFLLLTNICGLSSPLSGWHKPPPSSDASLEANLIRIKLYRNELYGHVTSTGVETAAFNVKWQEISKVLVALGLNPAEVVRLKSAPCGEDYISAVIEWVKSDEEIKSQLGEVRKNQQEARQMQEEDHKTLQDTHDTVEDVWKIHKDTHEVVKEVLKTQQGTYQIEHKRRKAIQGTQRAIKDVRQINQDTQQVVKEVLKTQQEAHQMQHEDHSTLQVTQHAVENVLQINQDTLQVVKEVLKTQREVHLKQQETAEELRQTQQEHRDTFQELHQTQTKTQQIFEDVVKTHEEHLKNLQAAKQAVDSFKEGIGPRAEDQVLRNLAKSEFKGDIEYHVGRYQEGTREWVFNEVENWLGNRNSENRIMGISSNAGMGKTVISAVICKRMQEAGRLSGSHFCQHNNARYRNPQLMLQSLSCHLSHALPEYKQALVKQLSINLGKDLNNMGVEELFALLFKEPLSTVADPGRNMLMVIDGLDESDYQERNELLDVLANQLSKLPCWIRFLCTTRPERNISEALKHLKPFQLESNDDKNMEDIKRFIENRTQHLIKPEKKGALVEKLLQKTEGLMLYAYFLVLFIEENKSVLDQEDLHDNLPLAISSAYHSYFKRLENELKKELGVNEETFLNLLSAIIASREPMPIDFVSKLLGPSSTSPLARRKVLRAISCVSSLLPIRDGCLHVIHKSVKDWLTNSSCYGKHDFTMSEKDGHRILASLCGDELDDLKQKGVRDAQFNAKEKYALHHGVRHMLQLDENVTSRNLEECIQAYVIDLDLLYAKICVNNSMAAEEILWLQSQDLFSALCGDSKDLLDILMVLLRKHFSTLTDHPHVFFQIVLNEGGSVLSAMASNILENKYTEIPYMGFVNKQMQRGVVLARFECSSAVLCFDVSPQSDFMVCEVCDGTIHLWSLHTGKLLWTRPVKVEKSNAKFWNEPFRRSPSLSADRSCYRSVVFHPTKKVVLPGVLSHAYDFNGDLKPVFPKSHCSFTVCSISGDKTTMLTDCPHNAKCIIKWSLKTGSEVTRITRFEDVLSFAWSRDGKLLAISHLSGLIAFFDAVDGFRTLGQTDLRNVCGMIKFSPDSRSLLCYHLSLNGYKKSTFRLNINIAKHLTCRVDLQVDPYVTWEFESRSEGGFLLGDPLSCVFENEFSRSVRSIKFDFVLDKHTVLRSNDDRVEMLNINEQKEDEREAAHTKVLQIVFSLSGETIFVASHHARFSTTTVTVWNVASSELIAEKEVDILRSSSGNRLLAVKAGVLLITECTPELWNVDLSKCVRCWSNIDSVTDVIPISEERVACTVKEGKVIILDTTSGEILSTIQIGRTTNLLACNSKLQFLTWSEDGSLRLSDHKTTLWEKQRHITKCGRFSPAETFVIIYSNRLWSRAGIYVLDAVSGKTLHVLNSAFGLSSFSDCEFVSDEECVVIFKSRSEQCHVKLFDVKSGDLLSNLPLSNLLKNNLPLSNLPLRNLALSNSFPILNWTRNSLRSKLLERSTNCLAVSPCKRLVAIYQSYSKQGYKLVQVRLPGDGCSRKSNGTLNPGKHIKVQEGEQEECSCVLQQDDPKKF